MFGDEVNAKGHLTQLSTQEYLDYVNQYKRLKSVMSQIGPFRVSSLGSLTHIK